MPHNHHPKSVTKTATSALYDDNGEITIVYTVTFHGDDLRGNVPQLVVRPT